MSVLEVDYHGLPEGLRAGAQRYIERGVMPGQFLVAVFINNFAEAAVYADTHNQKRLRDIAVWLHNDAPKNCWGSVDLVVRWSTLRKSALANSELSRAAMDKGNPEW